MVPTFEFQLSLARSIPNVNAPVTTTTTGLKGKEDIFSQPNKKIDDAVQDGLKQAAKICGTEERAMLERQIHSLANDAKNEIMKLYTSGIFDAKNVEASSEAAAKRLSELVQTRISNLEKYNLKKAEVAKAASRVREQVLSSTINFDAFS